MPYHRSVADVAGDTQSETVTARGWDVIRLVVIGRTNREIEAVRSISENIVRSTCNASRSSRGSAIEPQSAPGRGDAGRWSAWALTQGARTSRERAVQPHQREAGAVHDRALGS